MNINPSSRRSSSSGYSQVRSLHLSIEIASSFKMEVPVKVEDSNALSTCEPHLPLEPNPRWDSYQRQFANIPLLSEPEQWKKWDSEIQFALMSHGDFDLLRETGDKEPEEDAQSLQRWRHRQALACVTVRSRLDPSVRREVGEHKTINALLSAVDDHFKPKGAEAFVWHSKLAYRLRTLSLSKHDSFFDYVQEIYDIQMLYKRIEVELPESVYVWAFVDGLPSSEPWVPFLRQVLCEDTSITSAGVREDKPLLTLEQALIRATLSEMDEQVFGEWSPPINRQLRQRQLEGDSEIPLAGRRDAAVEIFWCLYCKSRQHLRSECDRL